MRRLARDLVTLIIMAATLCFIYAGLEFMIHGAVKW